MNTSTIQCCMALIVAMAMQCGQITAFICSPLTSGSDVVNFDQVAIAKMQFTVAAFSLLFVKQGPKPTHRERVGLLQPSCPIEQIAVKRRSSILYLDMSLDWNTGMIGEMRSLRGCKSPMVLLDRAPIFVGYPTCRLAWMAAFGPSKQEWDEVIIAIIQSFL